MLFSYLNFKFNISFLCFIRISLSEALFFIF
nr:MAG TPA: hypothetical protein [Bacteriophage sp.]